ncbi:MAG: hypothetical protein Q9221_001104 [Calogaya cf. arnoldii]
MSGYASIGPCLEVEARRSVAYTIYNLRQRRLLTCLLDLTTSISPLTATIHFPLLPLLARRLNTSAQAINLTITIYIIFRALSPAIFATLSDSLGRRIVYLITLTFYVPSNLGLALARNSQATLPVLRAIQSLGASAASAIAYGVIADVCVPAERGSMVGPISMALNLGTCIGPIFGGVVAYRSVNYGWIFCFLVFVGVLLLAAIAGFLPEIARNVVGNGSVEVTRWWERTWTAPLRSATKGKDSSMYENAIIAKKKWEILNPLQCLKILLLKEAAPILLVHGFSYMIDFSVQTSIASAFTELYHFNELAVGLSYLPRGVGIIVGGYANGKFMDRNYKITANQIGHMIDREHGDDINDFPIERARTRGSPYLIGILTCSVVGYRWALDQHSHVSVALILQFIQGVFESSIYVFSSTLLIDILSDTPSTAAATASITRCALTALGTATVQPLIVVLGRGWYFTSLGLFTGVASLVAIWTIRTWGMRWTIKRVTEKTQPEVSHVASSDESRLGIDDKPSCAKNAVPINPPEALIKPDGRHAPKSRSR